MLHLQKLLLIKKFLIIVLTSTVFTTLSTVTTSRVSTTTTWTTGPGHATVSSPVTESSLYVSSQAGADTNDGFTVDTALKTLKTAANRANSGTKIYLMEGEYNNNNFGGGVNNGAVMTIKGLQTKPCFPLINCSVRFIIFESCLSQRRQRLCCTSQFMTKLTSSSPTIPDIRPCSDLTDPVALS